MGQVIHDSAKRLEHLIEHCLTYAQIELLANDPQKIGILWTKQTSVPARLIESHARNQTKLAHREADLVLELSDTPAPLSEDYPARVTDELVQNAFKFSPRGKFTGIFQRPSSAMLVSRLRFPSAERAPAARSVG